MLFNVPAPVGMAPIGGNRTWEAIAMEFEKVDGKKVEVIGRIDRLKDLVEQDAPPILLENALDEIGRALDGLTRIGRSDGETGFRSELGAAPPAL